MGEQHLGRGNIVDSEPPKDMVPHDDLRLLVTASDGMETSLIRRGGSGAKTRFQVPNALTFFMSTDVVARPDIQQSLVRLTPPDIPLALQAPSLSSLRIAFSPEHEHEQGDSSGIEVVTFPLGPRKSEPQFPIEEGIHEFYRQTTTVLDALLRGSEAVDEVVQSDNVDVVSPLVHLIRNPEIGSLVKELHMSMQRTLGVETAINNWNGQRTPQVLEGLKNIQRFVDPGIQEDSDGFKLLAFHVLFTEPYFNIGNDQGRKSPARLSDSFKAEQL